MANMPITHVIDTVYNRDEDDFSELFGPLPGPLPPLLDFHSSPSPNHSDSAQKLLRQRIASNPLSYNLVYMRVVSS